ncbi:hypothetical protein PEL8287_02123 [Roseovarius litorisediminis]|uniref:Sulfotransferase family protein n=1 Tax=Roseovarius litorisediminis TaxID=1312363 RepID=A0A1Y5SK54_9RHOB|nr:sulfotransferase family 2 domain-containing protein [Roseovarius litorisediminis]SLN42682.1 hypothetical protein PEL8287_02123 [Roseovarius litorisediminis]
MPKPFDYFIVFAAMRTGSNFLESNLNSFAGFECHGELFNPHFIGYPNRDEILGVTQAVRDADPARLLETVKTGSKGLGGFRFFHDHDPRVLDLCLKDPRCAKVILTRNPLDSYVSRKIAQVTGQWKLTNVKRRKVSTITFDGPEFERHIARLQEFQGLLANGLQKTGQTAFYLDYEDLQDLEIMNGLAQFLGSDEKLDALDSSVKKQNPSALRDKVLNFSEMERTLRDLDHFNITQIPNFEPRRGPGVPGYVAGAQAPILYMPIRSGPESQVRAWIAALDGVSEESLPEKMNQKGVRQWKRRNPGHRSFTVLRHPVARAHAAFCEKILAKSEGSFLEIRKTLRNAYDVPLPECDPSESKDYDRRAHRNAFVGFLKFLRANLLGQTALRVDAHWATQASVVQGMAQFSLPDMIIREDEMLGNLAALARQIGYVNSEAPPDLPSGQPFELSEIYDGEIETLASTVYQRDYMMFGFEEWK